MPFSHPVFQSHYRERSQAPGRKEGKKGRKGGEKEKRGEEGQRKPPFQFQSVLTARRPAPLGKKREKKKRKEKKKEGGGKGKGGVRQIRILTGASLSSDSH